MTNQPRPAACDYCKLPLPPGWWDHRSTAEGREGPFYCCLGCQIAAAILEEKSEQSASHSTLVRLGLAIFCTMNVMAFTMALWTTDVYGPLESSSAPAVTLHGLFRHLVLLFSLPVLFFLGFPLFRHAWADLRRGVLSTDWLLASGVAASFTFSFLSVIRGKGPIYFEVGCVILVMTTLGRWLEASGKLKANAALDALAKLLPEHVRRVMGDEEELLPLDRVEIDDCLRVLPGERFPADGHVVRNRGLADEQVLTGESRPVLKEPGDRVLGGTLNLDGDLTIRVSALGENGTLARLVELVREARESKGKYQRLADRVASRFVPAVFAVALSAALAHWAFGSLERGFWAGLAVALIACPCALGLAAPLAIWTALGNAAGQRVLFRSGEALERLAEIVAVRFDKTGTLTTGAATVSHCILESDVDGEAVLARAAALASVSDHALSRAIAQSIGARAAAAPGDVTEIHIVPGLGIQGMLADTGSVIVLGSVRFLCEQQLVLGPRLQSAVDDAEASGMPVCIVGWDQQARGLFVFEEQWRPAARAVTRWLTAARMDVGVLTGDHSARGRLIARELGVSVEAQLLPRQKVQAIDRVHRTLGPVCMVGDGINDAPALAASDVGIALGCGTDVSRDSASVCLLGDELNKIPWAIELARRTRRVIRWNLLWAFGYNSVGIGFAALGWLNPALAAFLMAVSSALVTVNSLRLNQPFALDLDEGADRGAAPSIPVAARAVPVNGTAALEPTLAASSPIGAGINRT
jgi:heavy metal translocating P-type ATPase